MLHRLSQSKQSGKCQMAIYVVDGMECRQARETNYVRKLVYSTVSQIVEDPSMFVVKVKGDVQNARGA